METEMRAGPCFLNGSGRSLVGINVINEINRNPSRIVDRRVLLTWGEQGARS